MKNTKAKMARWFARALPVLVAFLIIAGPTIADIIGSLPYTLTNGTTADATQVMANYNKIITDVNANAAKNGVNSDITAITGLTTPLSAAQGGSNVWYGATSTGSANAQSVATLAPNNFSLVAGNTASFLAGFTNTGATTLALNGTAATNIFKRTPGGVSALVGGEIISGTVTTVRYDGTQYQLLSDVPVPFGPLTSIASGGTTDLGTIVSHNANITGTTSITSFGSSASTTFPYYKLTFAGALTLTHNGTSLILPGGANITTAANASGEAIYLGSGNWRVTQYQQPNMYPGTGQLEGVQIFTANGTWTRPAGVRSAEFWCAGGGGGGASIAAPATSLTFGSGGAGGVAYVYTTSPAASYTITVPAAASGGASGASNAGSAGGTVTVGALLTCNGGGGGSVSASASGGTIFLAASGAAGGTASGGTLNLKGGAAGVSFSVSSTLASSAPGGSNVLGVGADAVTVTAAGTTVAGSAGDICGGGGSAAAGFNPGVSRAGGAGGVGCVIVKSYY